MDVNAVLAFAEPDAQRSCQPLEPRRFRAETADYRVCSFLMAFRTTENRLEPLQRVCFSTT
jgi:hypothetical protein